MPKGIALCWLSGASCHTYILQSSKFSQWCCMYVYETNSSLSLFILALWRKQDCQYGGEQGQQEEYRTTGMVRNMEFSTLT